MVQMGKKILLGELGKLFNQFRFSGKRPAARHAAQTFQHLPRVLRGKLVRAHQPVPYDLRLVLNQGQGILRIMEPQPVHHQSLGRGNGLIVRIHSQPLHVPHVLAVDIHAFPQGVMAHQRFSGHAAPARHLQTVP